MCMCVVISLWRAAGRRTVYVPDLTWASHRLHAHICIHTSMYIHKYMHMHI